MHKFTFWQDDGTMNLLASMRHLVAHDEHKHFARAAHVCFVTQPTLSTNTSIKATDTMSFPGDIFGSAPSSYGPTKRLGSNASRLSQIQDGKGKVVSDYFKF